jgi:hypothetical protein
LGVVRERLDLLRPLRFSWLNFSDASSHGSHDSTAAEGIDVLDCRKSEQGQDFFVRWKGRWWGVSRCQTQDATRVLRCRSPYPLRIDLRGSYPKVISG